MSPLMTESAIRWELIYPSSVFAGMPGYNTLDMVMGTDDLLVSSRRWTAVWADPLDPRRYYFKWFTGWMGFSSGPKRWDFVTKAVHQITNDHEWHQTIRFMAEYVDEPIAHNAMISIALGESRTTWITREDVGITVL
jgi:hypothetical protein